MLQRAREIAIMRLVGATNGFIRGPFLLEGALKGLLGGLLAVALCYAQLPPVPRPERAGHLAASSSSSRRRSLLGMLFGVADRTAAGAW